MGGKDKKEIIKNIMNEINNETKNFYSSIATISNETVNEITNENINIHKQNMIANQTALNQFILENTTIETGAILTNEQMATVSQVTRALLDISTDNESMTTILTDVSNSIVNKVSNDNDLKNKYDAISSLLNEKNVDGEINNIANKVSDTLDNMVNAVTGRDVTKLSTTDIQTEIKNMITNENKNQVKFENYVKNIVNTSFKTDVSSLCSYSTTAVNNVLIRNVVIRPGARIDNNMIATVDAFNTCIISSVIKNSSVLDIITQTRNKSTAEVVNNNKLDNDLKVSNSISNLEKTTSIIEALLSSMTIMMVIVFIVILVLFILMLKPNNKSTK